MVNGVTATFHGLPSTVHGPPSKISKTEEEESLLWYNPRWEWKGPGGPPGLQNR